MIRKTISMPDEMGAWINEQIQSGKYNNESEYLRELIRKDQAEKDEIIQLRKILIESEKSGISNKSIPDIMKEVEERLQKDGKLPTYQ